MVSLHCLMAMFATKNGLWIPPSNSSQQSNKSNNGSTYLIGWECNTRAVIKILGMMASCMAAMALHSSGSTVNHFYDAYDTSNNHTICAPNKLVGGRGDSISQGISNGAMCFTVAISAVCLVFMTGLIQTVYAIGSR